MRKTSKNLEHAAFLVCMKDTVKYYWVKFSLFSKVLL
jgi:hypothetical protein